MGAVILTILKMIGIVFLCILGLILLLIGLLLFVPVRYRITAQKDAEDELKAARVTVRVTWLLHLLNVCFAYPERAYVRIRVLFFTVFRSDRPKKEKEKKQKERSETTHKTDRKGQKDPKEQRKKTQDQQTTPDGQKMLDERSTTDGPKMPDSQNEPDGQKIQKESEEHRCQGKSQEQNRQSTQDDQSEPKKHSSQEESPEQPDDQEKLSFKERFLRIVSKVWEILKNIRYTIRKIYDKIMDIIGNIRYYTEILKSDLFKETFQKCSGELLKLLKSIAPRKVKGRLRIGMEDPATTGKILGYYGMLYPLIGDHIDVVPDFEQTVLEGNILIKGKITLFKAIKTGIIVYFNKDLRKLIQLWKREGT